MRLIAIAGFALTLTAGPAPAVEGDHGKGEKLFRACRACHQIGEGAENRVGPQLNDVIGRGAGSLDGFRYSQAMMEAGANGLVWDEESLSAYIEKPRKYMPGTKMIYAGMSDGGDRNDLIAYLVHASGGEEIVGFEAPAELLAMEGDAAFGEYLAGECTICHRPGADPYEIPPIVGLDRERIVFDLHAYRVGERQNQVMELIAGRLADDEIAALAEYFSGLE